MTLQVALGSKGALYLRIEAAGRMAHSAYPELGESAIDRPLEATGRGIYPPAFG